jgi:hypothetical protein
MHGISHIKTMGKFTRNQSEGMFLSKINTPVFLLHIKCRNHVVPIQWVPAAFPVVKRQGRSVNHPSLSSAEVKERVELYL